MKINNLLEKIYSFPRFSRILLLISIDILIIYFSVNITFNFDHNNSNLIKLLFISLSFFSTLTNFFSGFYLNITRFIGSQTYYKFAKINLIVIFLIYFISKFFNFRLLNIFSFFKLYIISTSLIFCIRIFIRDLVMKYSKNKNINNSIAIYGAGAAGTQLLASLKLSRLNIIAFFDDNPKLWGTKINEVKIYPPHQIYKFKDNLKQILLAIPSIKISRKRTIIKILQNLELPILDMPSIDEITKGKTKIDALRPIPIEELLGREVIEAQSDLMKLAIKNKTILITGAGGSIGSELCRQVIQHMPKKIVLLEISEENLYKINEELLQINIDKIEMISVLGSSSNYKLVSKTIKDNNIDIIFHAAAYKHVPIVELNPIEGIKNNIFSTVAVCEASVENHIEKLILISTDKSVRPTNIMGASKRVAELVVQAYAEKESTKFNKNSNYKKTFFSMVRFGNVLGSSGSVVLKFKEQIKSGGPITLTDPNIIRYFMTIKEAAQLVIQSSVLSKGGDIFLLDMGDPVKIYDLAKQMVNLSGLSIKNKNNLEGDIEIISTGLRPGEKLYEELLIDAEAEKTDHPLIFRARENFIIMDEIFPKLKNLKKNIDERNKDQTLKILSELVKEWENQNKIN
ncbi:UDP-N-acetylglucosamine 4,6-dehydratase [Prochlorococcus marinus str. MIT 9302]|uniref:UDP-N-acetylglucosamine 4,6-dehydratase n=2 Tax=Prochlorococcus marinus TaxID=1219 RepID=A0A0A2A4R7_PROMR|nr:UDP-N-acetylglucosamine 4,6-dehydratase [Prochlorococcus marinus str. MIT 9302]